VGAEEEVVEVVEGVQVEVEGDKCRSRRQGSCDNHWPSFNCSVDSNVKRHKGLAEGIDT